MNYTELANSYFITMLSDSSIFCFFQSMAEVDEISQVQGRF